MDGSNALNKSMQGLWSAHRKAKLNLNAAVPPTPPPTTTVSPPPQPAPSNESVNVVAHVEELVEGGPSTGTQADANPSPPSTDARPPSSKRKLRRVAGDNDGTKRPRITTTTSGGDGGSSYAPPTTRLSDLGGVESCIEKMLELVAMPLCHPEIYLYTGVQPPRGVLLHGPPGCGKTLLANAIAGELGVPFISISAPSIVSGMSGESEKTLRDTFEEAKRVAPCPLSAQREMERRIVAQFLTCMDDMSWENTENKPVIVIGATNRPDSLDAALRRAGRFDHEISMGVPDEDARNKILRVLCAKLRLEGDFDYTSLAKSTPGYVGADLSALTGAAGVIAVKRIFKELSEGTLVLPDAPEATTDNSDTPMVVDSTPHPPTAKSPLPLYPTRPFASLLNQFSSSSIAHFLTAHPSPLTGSQLAPIYITSSDFHAALSQVQPSSKREGFATVPDVTWSDIGALHNIREELQMAIVQPIRRPELFSAVGNRGCVWRFIVGSSWMWQNVACKSRPRVVEQGALYVGESERAVRQVFSRARASSPCVVFFDELDALVPRRDDSLSDSSARVVNTLLTELDGLDARKSVYVIGATNRPDIIDPAMVRPGRLDKLLYVDLPTASERVEIVRMLMRRVPVASGNGGDDGEGGGGDVREGVERLVRERCEGYSGADLAAMVREAGVIALRGVLGSLEEMEIRGEGVGGRGDGQGEGSPRVVVGAADFVRAVDKVGPSVSVAQRRKYEALRTRFAGLPVRVKGDDGGRMEEVV
ncbi:ribosome biogenesis ATPase RIX7 [Boletus edulis]|nr:ribosome biogenesis ATPase RIX7 [Boletus edulis]